MRALELKASLLLMASRVFPRVLTLPRQLGVPNSDLPWDPGHSALSLLSWEAGAFGQGHPPVDAGNPALENRSSISSGCSAPSSPPKLLSVGAMLGRTVCCSPGNSRCPSPWVQQPTQSFHGQGYMDSPRSRCCIHVVETAGLGPHDRALGGSSVTGACRDRAKADRTCQVREAGPCVCLHLRDVRSQLSRGSHAHGDVGTKPHNTASPP